MQILLGVLNKYQFTRDEQNMNNGNPADAIADGSSSFKCKSSLLEDLFATNFAGGGDIAAHRLMHNAKVVVPIKYLSNFFRLLEMLLISCKIHIELNWKTNCAMSNIDGASTFKITSAKLFVPVATLSTKDNVNLTKQLDEGFKRPVYWNEYKSQIETKEANNQTLTRFPLDASFQGINSLFAVAFNNDNTDANRLQKDSIKSTFFQE